MAGDVVNLKVCIPLKLRSGLIRNYHAICHYSYNLPLAIIIKKEKNETSINLFNILLNTVY